MRSVYQYSKSFISDARKKPKFYLTLLIKFLLTIILTLSQTMKESIIVNFSGYEIIPALKFFPVIIFIGIMTFISIVLTKKIGSENTLIFFLIFYSFFYFIYSFYLLPNYQTLVLSDDFTLFSIKVKSIIGASFFPVIKYWFNSLFFIITESWGPIILAWGFWTVSNKRFIKEEAKKYYGYISCLGSLGYIAGGLIHDNISKLCKKIINKSDFLLTVIMKLKFLIIINITITILVMILFKIIWQYNKVSNDDLINNKNNKKKISLFESIKNILKSSNLVIIASITICYTFTFGMTESCIKFFVSNYYKSIGKPENYDFFISIIFQAGGVIAVISGLFTSFLIRHLNIFVCSVLCPFVMICPLFLFLILLLFNGNFSLISFVIFFGALSVVSFKAIKISLFDPIKEILYIAIENNKTRSIGKQSIDIFGYRFGKMFAAIFQIFIFNNLPNINNINKTYILATVAIIIGICWICLIFKFKEKLKAL